MGLWSLIDGFFASIPLDIFSENVVGVSLTLVVVLGAWSVCF